jgi:hypothetical protein
LRSGDGLGRRRGRSLAEVIRTVRASGGEFLRQGGGGRGAVSDQEERRKDFVVGVLDEIVVCPLHVLEEVRRGGRGELTVMNKSWLWWRNSCHEWCTSSIDWSTPMSGHPDTIVMAFRQSTA